MYFRTLRRFRTPRRPPARGNTATAFILCAAALLLTVSLAVFLQNLSAEIAVSDASDVVTTGVNRAIADIMREGDYSGDYFVTFIKSDSGEVTAISSNMAHINELSARVLDRVVGATEKNTITVKVPAGNFTGISFLMGCGPRIPLKIEILTTSSVDFNSSIVSAGINQSRHRIDLVVNVAVQVLIPWCKRNTNIRTEVLIADTVIVGKVPDTYLNVP